MLLGSYFFVWSLTLSYDFALTSFDSDAKPWPHLKAYSSGDAMPCHAMQQLSSSAVNARKPLKVPDAVIQLPWYA